MNQLTPVPIHVSQFMMERWESDNNPSLIVVMFRPATEPTPISRCVTPTLSKSLPIPISTARVPSVSPTSSCRRGVECRDKCNNNQQQEESYGLLSLTPTPLVPIQWVMTPSPKKIKKNNTMCFPASF